GLVIHYSILVLSMSLSFWITSAQGIEGGYFTLTEFSRLPREAFKGFVSLLFVWVLPVVVVSNAPAKLLIPRFGFDLKLTLGLFAATIAWFAAAVFVFHRGLRRYSSASS
ncbi:MAG: ABC-2 family transporter protein, partial [Opitutaceae bacterium]